MKAVLRLAHITAFHNPVHWNANELRQLAREALEDDDKLRVELARLRRVELATPRFQGMDELA